MDKLEKITVKLKQALIRDLMTDNELDKPYLHIFKSEEGKHTWTRRELARELIEETDLGIDMMVMSIRLAVDLIERKNK